MKRLICMLSFIMLVPVLTLWAGGTKEKGGASGGSTQQVKQKYHFVLVNNMASLPFFSPDYEGAQLACDEITAATGDEVTFEVVGPSEYDLLKQVEAMENALAKKPDGFMVVCWNETYMEATINKAMAQGIPVITVDADSPGSNRLCYIGTDWYTLGEELARALAKEIGGKGKVAMLGIVGAENMETAFRGFKDVMAANYPDVKIVALEHENNSVEESARITRALIQKYPDIAGFVGFDQAAGPGIATAVREEGKSGKIKVVSNNIDIPQLQAMKDGTIQFLLGQKRKFFGYWGVMMLYIHIKSNLAFTADDKEAGITNIPPRIVTGFLRANKNNVDLYWNAFEKYSKK
jgi:ribose transport system substrate-binding protein